MADQLLLYANQLGVTDLDTQIATGDHHSIGTEDDVFHRLIGGDGFGALNLGHDLGIGTGFAGQLAGITQVITTTGEGDSQIVHIHAGSGLDVFLVFLGQGRSGETAPFLVDALVVGERPSSSSRMSPCTTSSGRLL